MVHAADIDAINLRIIFILLASLQPTASYHNREQKGMIISAACEAGTQTIWHCLYAAVAALFNSSLLQ